MFGFLKSKPHISGRTLTWYYLTALAIIAGLTIASHLVVSYVLHHNQGTAAIINVSGRQRMLSQRIASLAAEYEQGDQTAYPDLIVSINEFEASESALSAASQNSKNPDPEMREIQQIYTGKTESLDSMAQQYIANAREIVALPRSSPAAEAALAALFKAARAPLLNKLDEIVDIHQRDTEHVLHELSLLQLGIGITVMLTLLTEAIAIFRPMVKRITLFTSEIIRLATVDPLTELLNRRGFLDRCSIELSRARRFRRPLTLMLLDVDHFKNVNDTYGHEGGDEALRLMARALRDVLRGTDLAGRIGGEEFAVLLVETDLVGALQVAERLRTAISNLSIEFQGHMLRITASIGVSRVSTDSDSVNQALRDADHAMYRAKQAGRNLVVCAETI